MASPGAFGENCCVLESGRQCLEWEGGMVRGGHGSGQGEVGEAWLATQEDVRGRKQG